MASADEDLILKVGLDGSDVKKDMNALAKNVQQILNQNSGKSSTITSLQNQIRKTTQDLQNAIKKQDELAKTPVYSDTYKQAEAQVHRYTDAMKKSQEQMRELKATQRELSEQPVPTKAYQELQANIKQADSRVENLIAKQKRFLDAGIASGGGWAKTLGSDKYKQMTQDIENAKASVERLRNEEIRMKRENEAFTTNRHGMFSGEASKEYVNIVNKLQAVQAEYEKTRQKAMQLNATIHSEKFQQANVTPGKDSGAYDTQSAKVSNLENRLAQLVQRYNEVGEAGHKSGSKQGLGARIAQKAWSGFKGGFKNVIKSFKGFGKEANSTFEDVAKNAKSMFWKILKYGLSIRSLYALIRKLRNTFKESIQVMGMDIPRIRDELNSLINGFQQVKYSLATAFQPIFSYIVPALNALISALNSAMVAIANFFATLTGQKVIYKATKQNKDYAKSISGAGKAAEDANEDIAEYDKLIVINQDKGGGGGGGGGDSGLDSGIFEEAPAKINELAQLIKEAWKKADFTDVGAYIGNKLKKGLESIKWGPIKETARKVGRSFATLINGFVTVPDLGKRIGSTIAEGINTAWSTVNEFVKNLKWEDVGTFIGDAISSALTTLDFSMLGENLGLGLTGIANTIYGIFSTLNQNLPSILDNINRGIDRFLDTFDPVAIGKAFGEVSTFILDFVDGVLPKLPEIAEKIGDTFNELIKNLDAEKLARTISNFIKTAIDTATTFIKKVDFKKLAEKIGDFLKNLDIIGIVKDLANLLWEVIKAAFEMLPTLIKEAPLESALIGAFAIMKFTGLKTTVGGLIGTAIGNAFSGLGTLARTWGSKLFGPLKSAIVDYVNWNGIGSLVGGVFKWGGAIAGAIVAAIGGWKIGNAIYNSLQKDLSGDNAIDNAVDFILGGDPRKVMKDATAGLDFKSLIYEQLQNPYYQARQEVEKLGLTGKEAYNYLATELDKIDVEGFIEANKTGVSEVDDAAKDLLQTWKDEQLASAEAKYGVEEVKKSYEGIPTSAKEAMEQANKSVSSGIDDLKTQAEEVSKSYNGMPSEIQTQLEKSNSALYQSFGGLKTQFEDIRKVLEGTPEEVKSKIEEVQGKLAGLFDSTEAKAEDVKKSYAGIPSDVQDKVEKTNKPISSMFDEVSSKVTNVKIETDKLNKSMAKTKGTTTKTTKSMKSSFKSTFNLLETKTDAYNRNMQDMNDTMSKSIDTTTDKITTMSTELDKTGQNVSKNWTTYGQDISTSFTTAWSTIKKTYVAEDINKVGRGIATQWGKYGVSVRQAMTNAWSKITGAFNGTWGGFKSYTSIIDMGGEIETKWSSVATNVQGAMTNSWKAISDAFNTPISLKISDDLSGITGSLNALPNILVDNINNTLERLRQSINTIIDRVNYLSSKLKGMTVPHIEKGQMTVAPLANGGVIPPNKEFLALLGDQKQGVNIETPLQTMVDAFNQALDSRGGNNSSNSAPIVLQLNGREIARAVWDEDAKRYKQTGRYSPRYS